MRRLLLDTHVVLWWLSDDQRLDEGARRLIANPANHAAVSAASVWEMAIKSSIGKLSAPDGVEKAILACGFAPLAITIEHAARVGELPLHHRDPFDRMLIAQAQLEGLELLTADGRLGEYSVRVVVI
ncbi:MAG: type II toxin-antitoxin system VapC family toxin [Acidimicrobiia bacterium]|nr:type II toxin-antitoxin system VapC family toxin [bacterium]MXX02117.1 type II toxin-antitoxin system VapC family toxin [Acidimicrobiia bacterium]MXX45754.1 type II toxin-antitoxin system VapC family toxin [Acidimicrobiia bacterium]MXY75096.1 type II toxin-antitoxin system VapC family toxin [Acidimicrobiia bacterium]MYA40080.1 type II toxin-antitoxin system VapC family toxin [Acidimicrobiia bacterium]